VDGINLDADELVERNGDYERTNFVVLVHGLAFKDQVRPTAHLCDFSDLITKAVPKVDQGSHLEFIAKGLLFVGEPVFRSARIREVAVDAAATSLFALLFVSGTVEPVIVEHVSSAGSRVRI
jgi:hypothetical protein